MSDHDRSHDRRSEDRDHEDAFDEALDELWPPAPRVSPGKRTLTQGLLAVRRNARSDGPRAAASAVQPKLRVDAYPASPRALHEAAQRGTSGAFGPLPYLEAIQRSFGRHDVSRIKAHRDGAAATGAAAVGAVAFAVGDRVAFGGAPDLHTAAHEAAHVVQQRAGVQLEGGVGAPGDPYERHADAVADRVVQGESAEALLDQFAPSPGPSPHAIQRKYRYSTNDAVWLDRADRQYRLTGVSDHAGGKELTFQPVDQIPPAMTFVVPAQFGDKTFLKIAADAVVYQDGMGHEQAVTDLDAFTGYDAPRAVSAFPAIPANDHQPAFHNTSFLGRVTLIPVSNAAGNEDAYLASELWVKAVKISNDRPPTKFGGEGQRSHTVAWSLLRAALQGLAGQQLDQLIAMLATMCGELQAPKAPGASEAFAAQHNRVTAGIRTLAPPTVASFSAWQRAASELLGHFVHAYQLSEEATYADGRAVGHGEPGHMETLRQAEAALVSRNPVPSLDEVKEAAVGMMDVKQRLDQKVIEAVLQHWVNDLCLAFPALMTTHLDDILGAQRFLDPKTLHPSKEVEGKPADRDVESPSNPAATALPSVDQSTFVANVVLLPVASVARGPHTNDERDGANANRAAVALGYYRIEQLRIEQVDVADDRPNTRFGVLQRSHTVAWTLVRRHLASFRGKPAGDLANFVLNELTTLQRDIDRPEENTKIGFDAPGEAAAKRANLAANLGHAAGFPLHQWQVALSDLIETYVTLYQLSRSATYSKEERPKGHGEANAITTLANAEAQLTAGVPDLAQFWKDNGADIVTCAAKLVDAAVATSNLKPQNWQIAIAHWLHLVKDQFPQVTRLPNFAREVEAEIAVLEPSDELLAGYGDVSDPRAKVLINLYENARKEAKSVPDAFTGDLQSSIRLKLATFGPPDYDMWEKIVSGLKLTRQQTTVWSKHIQAYMKPPARGKIRPVPDENAIKAVIDDVGKYFTNVKTDRAALVLHLYERMKVLAARYDAATSGFVGANGASIEQALGEAIDEAVALSAVTTIKNYQDWFDLINAIDIAKDVTYATLMEAINAKG